MNIFNEEEFNEICEKLNAQPRIKDITIDYSVTNFFNKMKKSIQNDRRGEVAFCVIRPNGKAICVTCKEYPEGIYRIPTGGIGHREDIMEAVFREAREELGLKTAIENFLGVLRIKLQHEGESIMFYSYLFVLKEVGGRLLEDATDDEVSEIREVDADGLEEFANRLKDIKGKWRDWGKFRYETSKAFLKHLRRKV